jgi:anaerobic magnesium-protoporphyrin IX monomethyl ester cyclase
MKICFITPGSVFLLDERVFVNLGVLKVAAACIERGHQVEHLDLDGVENYEEATRAHAAQSDADWFAITATTPQMPATARIVAAIRQAQPRAKVMIGGPHPTLAAAAAKVAAKKGMQLDAVRATKALGQLRDMFDVVVAGDGEDAIEQAMRIKSGLVDGDDPGGALFLSKKRLEELPPPARHLVDLKSYRYTIDGVPAASLVAQLGCPFACSFCGGRASPMLRRARMRPTESVLAEMEDLHVTHGYRGFMLYDDELNVNPKIVELMRGIAALAKKHNTEFRLRGFVKAELFTAEQAEAMYAAGFRWLLCGFESGHPRILDNINKRATVEDNDRMLSLARAAGLKVKALMSIGHAGESAETIEATKQWLLSRRPDDFDCTIITPYPGSPYYDEATLTPCIACGGTSGRHPRPDDDPADVTPYGPCSECKGGGAKVWTYTAPRTGDKLHAFEIDYTAEADYYKGKPGGGYVSHVFTDYLSPSEVVRLRDDLENTVRATLGIPFNAGAPGIQFEASMGQTKLPTTILRSAP